MDFINNSTQEVIVNIGEKVLNLMPSQKITLETDPIERISIAVRCNQSSYVESGRFKPTKYHLVIQTDYYFSGISNDEVFIVTYEQIKADSDNDLGHVLYEKAFLISEAHQPRFMDYRILSEDIVKKSYYRDFKQMRIFEFFIGTAVLSGIDAVVIGSLVSKFKGIDAGLKIGGISFIVIYLLHILGEWIADVFWKKATKQNHIAEFEKCFTDSFMHEVFQKWDSIEPDPLY